MTASSLPYRLFVGLDIAAKTCAVSWMSPSSTPSRATSAPVWDQCAWTTKHRARRKCPAATGDVYGDAECTSVQPGHSHVLPAFGCVRKAQEGGAACCSTEVVAERLGCGHAGEHVRPNVWTAATTSACVRESEADGPHTAPVKTVRGSWYASKPEAVATARACLGLDRRSRLAGPPTQTREGT
jgi:hypothetical protein